MSSCCNGTSGTIATPDPNKRVNYTFGLVLGVDEFVQEQTYFLEKHRRHDRLLHGYGTVAGLAVTTDTSTGVTQVKIAPGAAVVPAGQEICVGSTMCCTIETWLSQNAPDLNAIFGSGPFPLALDVCVVLCYRECPTDAVPVPGEPCRTQDNAMAASRIADSFELKLCLNATAEGWKALATASPPITVPKNAAICLYRPSQLEEIGTRLFGRILERIQITTESDQDTSNADFQKLILEIPAQAAAQDATPHLTSGPLPVQTLNVIYLNPANAHNVIRAGIETWVTQVRPGLVSPSTGAPCDIPAEQCVLLADLRIPVNAAFGLSGTVTVDTANRPWLLETRLLQEMLLSSVNADDSRETRTFVTACVVPGNTIRAWIHHSVPLNIPAAAVTLTSIANPSVSVPFTLTDVIPQVNVFDLTLANAITPGDRYKITFNTETIQEAVSPPRKLADQLNSPRFNYLDRTGALLVGYAEYAFASIKPGDAAGGDLTGTYPAPTIANLQGKPVNAGAPNLNQVLTWTGAAWQPANPPGSALGPANTDLSGTYPALTVVGLQKRPVTADQPVVNQVLTWTGAAWQPANVPAQAPILGPATIDLSGTYPALAVVGLQRMPVAAVQPTLNQVLTWKSAQNATQGQWVPDAGPFVKAPTGSYSIVAAGQFGPKLNAVGPIYGNLTVAPDPTSPTSPSSHLLSFDDYLLPTAKFTYILKAVMVGIADTTGVLQFIAFNAKTIGIRMATTQAGFMIEISRIGDKG